MTIVQHGLDSPRRLSGPSFAISTGSPMPDGEKDRPWMSQIQADEASLVFSYPKVPDLDGKCVCYALYHCRAGSVALAALEPHLWERFCRSMNREEWLSYAFTSTAADNPVYRELCSVFRKRNADDWETWGAQAALPLRKVSSIKRDKFSLPWHHNTWT